MNEPVPGWIDNYHGFIGLTAGSYVGVLRNAYAKKEKKLHLVPADFVCNCILAAAWDTANSKTVKVFNCVGKGISYGWVTSLLFSNPYKLFLLGELARAVNTLCWKYPTMKCMWNPETSLVQNKFWYNVKAFWMLMLAHCIDFVFFCFKKPAR